MTVSLTAGFTTIALLRGAARLGTEAPSARCLGVTFTVCGTLAGGCRTGDEGVADGIGGAAALCLVVHYLTLCTCPANCSFFTGVPTLPIYARLFGRTSGI